MDILYVFTSASSNPGSIQRKIVSQINALNAIGLNCKGLFFTTDETNEKHEPNVDFIRLKRVKPGYFRSARQRSAYHQAVYDYITSYKDSYDFVYYRYPGANSKLLKLCKLLGRQLFFEHVTAETNEIRLYKKENPIRWNLSSILSHFEFYFLPLYKECLYGKRIRKSVLMALCNSNQIADYERKLAGGHYKTFIQGDAVEVDSFLPREVPNLNSDFKMIFLKGAGTEADFNGLDRVFKGIHLYKGPYQIQFYLYGLNLQAEKKAISELGIDNQVFTGDFIQKSEIDLLMNAVHIGIGALAVHRKGFTETTTIKTREYCARGIPFVAGHNDPDFTGKEESNSFVLQLPSNDTPIDIAEIIDWYKKLDFKTSSVLEMQNFAFLNLDYTVKMKRLKTILENEQLKVD